MSLRGLTWPAIGAFVLIATGCAPNKENMLYFLRQHEHQVSAPEYRVGVPDSIAISAPRILEIDGETQTIQPDGKINLKLLGEVRVVGMTAKEIAAKLEVLLSRYYHDPKVRVTIANYGSKKFYIRSQAGQLATRPYTGRDTLLDAVVSSSVDFRSMTSKVEVIRPNADGTTPVRRIRVDVDKMIKQGEWEQNILLEPDDIVVIPPTPASWFAQRIREILFPLGPAIDAYSAPASVIYADEIYGDDNRFRGNRAGIGRGGFGRIGY